MSRFFRRGWLLLMMIGGMWFAPAVQARMCPLQLPSRYIPVLHVAEPVTHTAFDVREKGSALEIRNLSSDAIFLTNTSIDPTAAFTIDIRNAGIYMEKTPDTYCSDGGVADGEPVPQNIRTQFTVKVGQQFVTVPINIAYEANPDYARDLRDYQEHEKQGKAYVKALATLGALMFIGQTLLIIAGLVGVIFFLRWVKRRADERWE